MLDGVVDDILDHAGEQRSLPVTTATGHASTSSRPQRGDALPSVARVLSHELVERDGDILVGGTALGPCEGKESL